VPSDVLVVTPWYPTAERPFYGGFVTGWVNALQLAGATPEVLHLDNVADAASVEAEESTTVGGAKLTHVVVPQPAGASRADMAAVQADALRTLLPERWPDVRTVHAHVGMPTGWALSTTLPRDVRLVLTEHASYLNQIFRLPETAAMYADAVARADAVLAVSERMAATLRSAVPAQAGRIAALGNPVDFDRLPLLGERQPGLRRWLFLGNLLEAKGVLRLVEAFARADATKAGAGELTLTIVGDGPMRDALVERAEALGVAEKVTVRPGVPPAQVPEIYAAHDVLVHLSSFETFGMTVVEAVGSGLPTVVTKCGGPEDTVLHATDLGGAQLVDVTNDPAPVVDAWLRLVRRQGSVDWPTVRTLLEHRFAPRQVGAATLEHLGLATSGANDVPLAVKVVTLDHRAARQAAPTAALAADLGLRVSVATLPQGEGLRRIPARMRFGHSPRALTAAARAAVLAEPVDLVVVDPFVGAALVGRDDGLPPVVSMNNRARLWQAIARAIARSRAGRSEQVAS
jgi:glycogen(starch) synthase